MTFEERISRTVLVNHSSSVEWTISDQRRHIVPTSTQSILVNVRLLSKARNLHKVPFGETFAGRLQGVVSSGSDASRVYVAVFEAATGNFYCSTNNGRRCGGLGTAPCKHLTSIMEAAVTAYGSEHVIKYLHLDTDTLQLSVNEIMKLVRGSEAPMSTNEVFSRFIDYLRFVSLPGRVGACPEMDFFL